MMCSITCYQHVRSSSTTRASLTAYVGGVVVKLDVGNLVGVLAIDYFDDIDYINIINGPVGPPISPNYSTRQASFFLYAKQKV